ncbi:flavin-containing monooxygenase [Nocardioides alcanivorans]|uniref:flavin-containing monooxygenase n=1 Tax=Nocardioides alcanivorans TaxID=2897352 RepID=UPI001F460A77|nr:NAD(P)/FAD-dependent oxidoreductase [Nocardioides alcanivorans]
MSGLVAQHDAVEPAEVASAWLRAFAGLLSEDGTSSADVFGDQTWWRDAVTLTWDLRTFDRDRLEKAVAAARDLTLRPVGLLDAMPPSLAPDGQGLMLLFGFNSTRGDGRGVAHLVPGSDGWRAQIVFTQLESLRALPESTGARRPDGGWQGSIATEPTWAERSAQAAEFRDVEPAVVIIGAGHSGLSLAARLTRLGVATLIVEKAPRVGDGWRNRYRSLVLHDPVGANHLPYLPFPSTWPLFIPKDRMGDWLEHYSDILELPVWTGASVESASRDADGGWVLQVARDGETRTLRPAHVVMATGMSGNRPHVPELAGRDDFGGEVVHSSAFTTGSAYAGKRVLVVGSGNSGHDIAQDLAEHGARVTMLQRSPSYVISSDTVVKKMMVLYSEVGPPTEIADLISWSMPTAAATDKLRAGAAFAADCDKDLLDGLRAAGFGLTMGPDDTGMSRLFFERNGGYYIDVGCSPLIIDGTIGVKHGTGIERLEPGAVVFGDGDRVEFDAIVLATGYTGILETAREVLGRKPSPVPGRCGVSTPRASCARCGARPASTGCGSWEATSPTPARGHGTWRSRSPVRSPDCADPCVIHVVGLSYTTVASAPVVRGARGLTQLKPRRCTRCAWCPAC